MKRVVVFVCAVLVTVGLAGFEQAGAVAPSQAAAAAFTPAFAPWTDCGSLQCSTIQVPLDYADPGGQKITLAVTRAVHTASFDGMLLTNPGGPGGSGTALPSAQGTLPNNAGGHYDWVGFDPRGVGESVPSLHCNSAYFGNDRPNYVPSTLRLRRYWLAKTTRYAARCGSSAAAWLLPHMTTLDTVRDMESIRAAYQAQAGPLEKPKLAKLNYYGFSYGTYLGQVYAVRYPTKVGRFILDGVIDPTRYWYGGNLDQDVQFDRNLSIFFGWIAQHSAVYHLGRDAAAIRRGYFAELRTLVRHPSAQGRLGPDELTDGILGAGYYVFDWDAIATAYSRLVRFGHGFAMFEQYSQANQGDDNSYAVYNGVMCSDVRRPAWSQQVRDTWRVYDKHPFLAWDNTWYNAPCRTWPAPSHSRMAIRGGAVTAKILLINETRDAATPYSGALTVRDRFPTASLIAGIGGTTHAGSLAGGVGCVQYRIAKYLLTGAVPTRLAGRRADQRCPKVQPPPAFGAARTTGVRSMSPAVRDELLAAQWSFLR